MKRPKLRYGVFILLVGLLPLVVSACLSGRLLPSKTSRGLKPLVYRYLDTSNSQEANWLFGQLMGYSFSELLEILKAPRDFPSVPTGLLPVRSVWVNGKLNQFGMHVPPSYKSTRAYPMIVCLHGAGFDGASYIKRWAPRLGEEYILVCPTMELGFWWTHEAEDLVMSLVQEVMKKYHIDPNRIFLTGMSNGAIGTYLIGLNHADRFAGLIPMAGHLADPLLVLLDNVQTTPLYLIHGSKDEVISSEYSRTVETYLLKRGYSVIYQEHDQMHPKAGGHFFPKEELPPLLNWIQKQHRTPLPKTITVVKDREHSGRSYWIRIEEIDSATGSFWASKTDPEETRRLSEGLYARVQATIKPGNLIEIQTEYVRRLTVLLSGSLVNLDQPVRIVTNGELSFEGRVTKDTGVLLEEARLRPDSTALVSAAIEIGVPR